MEANYFCALCSTNRYVKVDSESHHERVKLNPNGLLEISDIHYCHDGILSINNLHVDHQLNVRSFSLMELPDKRRTSSGSFGIPVPSERSDLNTYHIIKMFDDGGYRIRLVDKPLRVNLNIGEVKLDEEPLDVVTSADNQVILYYYKSDIYLRRNNRLWFQHLVDALSELPPTRLGLFLEALRFVYRHRDEVPGSFEITQLKTLLTCHKTTFKLLPHNYKAIRNITSKYGEEKREAIDKIIQSIREDPDLTLQGLQIRVGEDLIFIIFLSIMLEIEGILEIHRDSTIESI